MARDLTIFIPEELFAPAESSSYSGTFDLPELELGGITFRFAEPLAWDVLVQNTSEALLVTGHITGTATTECVRCLEKAVVDVDGEVEGYYFLPGVEVGLSEEEEEDYQELGDDHMIDLEPLLTDALSLALPFTPLCSEDCLGLCPQCGSNLNEGPCGCESAPEEDESNPFAKLKDYKFD